MKQEKVTDSEEEQQESNMANTKSSPQREIIGIKKEKNNKNGSMSITQSRKKKMSEHSYSNDTDTNISSEEDEQESSQEIKKEKRPKSLPKSATFIPRPIKSEPQSDIEGDGIGKIRKRKNESSVNEQLDFIVDSFFNTSSSNLSAMQDQVLSSTLKIKQEPPSEDESPMRKKAKKPSVKTKSLETMENDLFNSFLK